MLAIEWRLKVVDEVSSSIFGLDKCYKLHVRRFPFIFFFCPAEMEIGQLVTFCPDFQDARL